MRSGKAVFFAASVTVAVCIMLIASAFASSAETEQVVQITAKKFEYSPKDITVKKGVPVVLEFTSLDRLHGFSCPDLGIRSDIPPNKVTRLRFVPEKAGTFPFHCDNFCGGGHEGMTGTIIVKE
jgi:cytochrome c oxidase subunit 2